MNIMSIFKIGKKIEKEEKNSDLITKEAKFQENKSDNKLKVIYQKRNIVIFSDNNSKYACLNNDFKNIIKIDDYVEPLDINSSLDYVLLKLNDLYSLFYYSCEEDEFMHTGFIFKEAKKTGNSLALLTSENKKYIFFQDTLFKDVVDYEIYKMPGNYNSDLILIQNKNYSTLYKIGFVNKVSSLFEADTITFYSYIKKEPESYIAIFGYFDKDKGSGYFIVEDDFLYDIYETMPYKSFEIISANRVSPIAILTDYDDKKYIQDIFSDTISKAYNSIKSSGELLLCQRKDILEIIDVNLNVYYSDTFEKEDIFSFSNSNNLYTLHKNGSSVLSLEVYNAFFNNKFFIISKPDNTKSLCFIKPFYRIDGLIKKLPSNTNYVFELEESYLLFFPDFLAFFDKNIIPDFENCILSTEHLKSILFLSHDKNYIEINSEYIKLLYSCGVTDIKDISNVFFADDTSLVIEAFNKVATLIITKDKVKVTVLTGDVLELETNNLPEDIIQYILENLTNEFSKTYLKYVLE